MIATSGFLAAVECTKFVFDRDSARTPMGSLQRCHRPPSWYKGVLLLSGGRGRGGRSWVSNHYNKSTFLAYTQSVTLFEISYLWVSVPITNMASVWWTSTVDTVSKCTNGFVIIYNWGVETALVRTDKSPHAHTRARTQAGGMKMLARITGQIAWQLTTGLHAR